MKWLTKWFPKIFKKEVEKDCVGGWQVVFLCKSCGEIISKDEIYYSDNTCRHCGHPSKYLMEHYQTSRRKVRISGVTSWEWSGKCVDSPNGGIPSTLMLSMGRKVINPTTTIAAAGLASGLF